MSRKALIIGSEGNVGKPLVKYLRSADYEVLEVDIKSGWRENYMLADINHPIDLLPAFDWEPTHVFLLSAMVSRVTCEQAGGLAVATNLEGVNNVLQLCKRVDAMTVFFSTSEVYGPECEIMDEAISDPKPNNRYGLTKLLGERLVEYETRTNGLRAVSLRPFMIYDENEDLGDHRSAMIRFAYDLGRGIPIDVHIGSARGWLHVSDAVRAIERAVYVSEYTVLNIGHPNVIPIAELAEGIRTEIHASQDLVREREIPGQMTLRKQPSLDRMRTILDVEPTVQLDEGIRRVCDRIRLVIAREKEHAALGK
ncbi:MAG: NAD(P)-dependent oxidoreductase [Rhodothermia bacterium]|nr:MAG: NAD(P)-dependent oxidoreductase [Rhodothermia bacterium]